PPPHCGSSRASSTAPVRHAQRWHLREHRIRPGGRRGRDAARPVAAAASLRSSRVSGWGADRWSLVAILVAALLPDAAYAAAWPLLAATAGFGVLAARERSRRVTWRPSPSPTFRPCSK